MDSHAERLEPRVCVENALCRVKQPSLAQSGSSAHFNGGWPKAKLLIIANLVGERHREHDSWAISRVDSKRAPHLGTVSVTVNK
jgi:hypothetical protein